MSLYLPSGSAGPERQASKDRFLKVFMPYLKSLRRRSANTSCAATGTSPTRRSISRTGRATRRTPASCRMSAPGWTSCSVRRVSWMRSASWIRVPSNTPGGRNRGQAWAKNVGWRIDYQIVTPGLQARGEEGLHLQGPALLGSRAADHGLRAAHCEYLHASTPTEFGCVSPCCAPAGTAASASLCCWVSLPVCHWRYPAAPCRPGWPHCMWTSPPSVYSRWWACRIRSSSCGRLSWIGMCRHSGASAWLDPAGAIHTGGDPGGHGGHRPGEPRLAHGHPGLRLVICFCIPGHRYNAYYIDILRPAERGLGAAVQAGGYRLAMICRWRRWC